MKKSVMSASGSIAINGASRWLAASLAGAGPGPVARVSVEAASMTRGTATRAKRAATYPTLRVAGMSVPFCGGLLRAAGCPGQLIRRGAPAEAPAAVRRTARPCDRAVDPLWSAHDDHLPSLRASVLLGTARTGSSPHMYAAGEGVVVSAGAARICQQKERRSAAASERLG